MKIEKILNNALSKAEKAEKKKWKIKDLLGNWEKINPYEVSDAQNRINILTGKTPRNRIFTYNDSFIGQYFKLVDKVNKTYSKILKETPEIEPRENKKFVRALKYKTKFYERGMTAKDLEYLENISIENLAEDIKEGRIESEVNKLEKELK